MAKINIIFNDKNYSVDESSLSEAIAELRQHLSTVMNGTGATITLDGTSYGIDSAKLSTATNAFVSHLGTIAGGSGGSDTLTWDGNTEGLECASNPIADMTWYRVSDVVLSADDLVNGVSITTVKASDGEEQSMDIGYDTIQSVITDDGCIKATFFFSIPTDNYSLVLSKSENGTELTALFEKAGIYFYASGGIYTSRLTIPNYTGFGSGSGYKVKVGGVEYSVSSTKVAGAAAELETTLGGLNSGDSAGGSDTLTWDGNTEGLEVFPDAPLYRVSDVTPTADDLINGGTIGGADGAEEKIEPFTVDFDSEMNAFYLSVERTNFSAIAVIIILSDAIIDGNALKAGIYFFEGDGIMRPKVRSLQINGYTGF